MKPVFGLTFAVLLAALICVCQPAGAQNGDWGTVKGQIVWQGDLPKALPIDTKDSKDAPHCLDMGKPPMSDDWVVNPKNKGIRWTFVWLAPATGAALAVHPSLKDLKDKEVVMDQPLCMFIPHSIAIREGQVLHAKNTSQIAHNYKWTGNPFTNPGGNVLIPSGGQHTIDNLKTDRLPVIIQCNIHPWMKAWVRVFNHPYFAVTDENGNFEIKDAPTGNCNLIVWHGTGGWRGGAAGKTGTPITIKTGSNDVGALPFASK